MSGPIQMMLYVHVFFGFIAFFVAPAALMTAKGGKAHRRWGKTYFWSMVVVALTAIVLSLARPNYFLAFVSVFSFYQAFRGYRVLSRKRPREGQGAKALDWAGAVLAVAASLALLALGTTQPGAVWVALGPVAIAFGIVGIFVGASDLRAFLYPSSDRFGWWYAHMQGMIASYIAAVSAFSVNTFHFLPQVARWLWPSAIGVPVIIIWIRYYRQRLPN